MHPNFCLLYVDCLFLIVKRGINKGGEKRGKGEEGMANLAVLFKANLAFGHAPDKFGFFTGHCWLQHCVRRG